MILTFYKVKDCKILNIADAYQDKPKHGIPSFSFIDSYNTYNGTPIYGDNIEVDTIATFDKNKKYDYLIFDGYDTLDNLDIKNIYIDTIILSHSGEFIEPFELKEKNQKLKSLNITCKRKIVLSPIEEYKHETLGWEMFLSPFAGLRFFQHYTNHASINPIYERETLLGLEWTDDKKEKLFSCLVGEGRPDRKIFTNELKKSEVENRGYTTWNGRKTFDSKYTDIDIHGKNPDRFKIQPELAKNSYIEIQCETLPIDKSTFITEKAAKPFLGLQFPIFFAQPNYIQYLRDWGFDMFDDIIDHSYDKIPTMREKSDSGKSFLKKSKLIVKEIEKLSKLDIHKLYLECKDRFLNNQKRLFELVHIDNNRHEEMAKFVFGNVYECKEIENPYLYKNWHPNKWNSFGKKEILKKFGISLDL